MTNILTLQHKIKFLKSVGYKMSYKPSLYTRGPRYYVRTPNFMEADDLKPQDFIALIDREYKRRRNG